MTPLFKPFDSLAAPDPIMAAFARIDLESVTAIPVELSDYYSRMVTLELPNYVPENIRNYFDVTRMLWVYGWYCYPFFSWAGLHAGISAEMAIRARLEEVDEPGLKDKRGRRRKIGLKDLLPLAINRGWLCDEGFAHVRRRNLEMQELEAEPQASDDIGWPEPNHETIGPFLPTFAKAFPAIRNMDAHATLLNIRFPGHSEGIIELAHDVIVQLYQPGPMRHV